MLRLIRNIYFILFAVTLQMDATSTLTRSAAEMRERRKHFGMTGNDFDYIRKGLVRLRRDNLRRFNQTAADTSILDRFEAEFNKTTSLRHIAIDDILLTRTQLDSLVSSRKTIRHKRATNNFAIFPARKWPLPIKYVIDPNSYNSEQAGYIEAAIQEWMRLTCVTFEKHQSTEVISDQYLQFVNTNFGCSSFVGMAQINEITPQPVSLDPGGCLSLLGLPTHEIGHAIGLYHEQSRPDRDSYVTLMANNIDPMSLFNFILIDSSLISTYNIPYDYGSVMHYSSQDFLSSNLPSSSSPYYTLLPSDFTQVQTMGQRSEISFYDAKSINMAYCPNACPTMLACQNGGYTNPKNCAVCRCPDGYGGTLCDGVPSGSAACNPTSGLITITATSASQCLQGPASFVSGLDCTWIIRTSPGQAVSLWFVGPTFGLAQLTNQACVHWVEVRYLSSHTTRGQRFCGYTLPAQFSALSPMVSQSSEVRVLFSLDAMKGTIRTTDITYYGFKLCFKSVVAPPTTAAKITTTTTTTTTPATTTTTTPATTTTTTPATTPKTTTTTSTTTTTKPTTTTTASTTTSTPTTTTTQPSLTTSQTTTTTTPTTTSTTSTTTTTTPKTSSTTIATTTTLTTTSTMTTTKTSVKPTTKLTLTTLIASLITQTSTQQPIALLSTSQMPDLSQPTLTGSPYVDLVFIIDSSYSQLATSYWQNMKNFLIALVSQIPVGSTTNQIGLIVMGSPSKNIFYLNSFKTASDIIAAIQNLQYIQRWTNLADGLRETTNNQFSTIHGDRTNFTNVAIIIMAWNVDQGQANLNSAIQNAWDSGIVIYSIGATVAVNQTQLRAISSAPQQLNVNYYFLTDSSLLPALATSLIKTVSQTDNSGCDLVFIVDSTYLQAGTNYWQQAINFIVSLVKVLSIGPLTTQVGFVLIGWPAVSQFYLNSYSNKATLVAAIQAIQYAPQWTHLANGLHEATHNQFTLAHGDRPAYDNVAVVVMATQADQGQNSIIIEAQAAWAANVKVISVGATPSVSLSEIQSISSSPHQLNSDYFYVSDPSQLKTLTTNLLQLLGVS